jgi:hypothetical protein
MENELKIRFPNELWWDNIPYIQALEWLDLQVTYLTDTNCFVSIVDRSGVRIDAELYRSDYDKIMSQKAFRVKFKLKKHGF